MLSAVRRVLVIEPHADDLVIGCGGLLAKLKEENENVEIFSILLSPSPRMYSKIKQEERKYDVYTWADRRKELQKAMEILGFEDVDIPYERNAHNIHHRLDTVPQAELIMLLEEKVKACSPDLVLIPERSYNQDHRALYDAFMTVARPHFYNGTVLAYETTMESEFRPDLIVKLSEEQAETKLKACCVYETQLGKAEHLFSIETMKTIMEYRGRLVFSRFGEAFRIVRGVY